MVFPTSYKKRTYLYVTKGNHPRTKGQLSLSGSFTDVGPSECFVIGFPIDIFFLYLIDFSKYNCRVQYKVIEFLKIYPVF